MEKLIDTKVNFTIEGEEMIRSSFYKDRREKVQELIDEWMSNEDNQVEYQEQEHPTDLRGLKNFLGISDDEEGKLIVAIYNKDIEAKIQIKNETRNDQRLDSKTGKYRKSQRFVKTKPLSLSTYSALKRRYKPNSLNALKTRLKHLLFRAISVNSTGRYNADDWCNLIKRYSNNTDALVESSEHGNLVDGIYNLIKSGEYKQAALPKRNVKITPNFISKQMI